MIDFPASPAVDQLFQASNNAIYKWNGTIWVAVGNTAALYVGDTPPVNPWKTQLWFKSDEARLYIYYDDGNTTQWVPAAPIPATSTPPTPTYPGSDAGCKTTYLPAQTALAIAPAWTSLVNTGLIGALGQKWRISASIAINNNPANWSYCEINNGATSVARSSVYNSVNGATASAFMEVILVLAAATTFTLRAQGAAAATAQNGQSTGITAERLT